jgi:hypothetical protein
LSSITSVGLRNVVSDSFSVALSTDCFELYRTPAALRLHVLEMKGKGFPTKFANLPSLESTHISWLVMGLLQAVGVVMLLFLVATPIIPACYLKVPRSRTEPKDHRIHRLACQSRIFPPKTPTNEVHDPSTTTSCKRLME